MDRAHLFLLSVLAITACAIKDKTLTGDDAMAVDATATDADLTDAAVIDAVATDADLTDAPDPIDAGCAVGFTRCGTACVDLTQDELHCGACNYEVRGGRTCSAGQPSPGWQPIASLPALPSGERAWASTWTGRRYMLLTASQARFFDPASNTWSANNAFTRPTFITTEASTWAKVPNRDEVAFTPSTLYTASSSLWFFTDDGAMGTWREATLSTTARAGVTIAATANDIYVGWGRTPPAVGTLSVVRYSLSSGLATSSSDAPPCATDVGYFANPLVVVGSLVVTHGGTAANTGPCLAPAARWAAIPLTSSSIWTPGGTLGVRQGHFMLPWYGRLLFGGGVRTNESGPASCANDTIGLLDLQNGTTSSITRPPQPTVLGGFGFAARTGRSVMLWGGENQNCNGTNTDRYDTGSIGVPSPSGNDITWAQLPTMNAPSKREQIPNGHTGWANQQTLWSGYEAIVFGGYGVRPDMSINHLLDGATYQPPVGCVCPDTDAAACQDVTGDIPTVCAPQ